MESGKSVICLDPEHEYLDLAENLGGCFIDLMSGQYMINPLEPKSWDDGSSAQDKDAPMTFRQATKLSQHISFLKDFFRCYKDFTDRHIDVIEIMLSRLYTKWNISDSTVFTSIAPTDYPILSDLYAYIEEEYRAYDGNKHQLYTAELLQEILLGLHSMCVGAESKFFNGHTNISSERFIVFGVKGLLQASKNVKNALLFNVLSFMSDKLLTEGNTAAAIDELYLFLTNTTAIEYIRNFMKRVRKKESSVILSSQNLEDFNIEGIREMTKPLFSMAKYEVTQELWESVMGSNPSRWKGPRNSVEMITYDDAQEFCRKLTVKLRAAALIAADEIVALPSEAQWEYCARAGTTTKYSFGDDAAQLGDYAWYTGNAAGNDPPVGAKKPNAWGLYDMHGYLWEICADDWAEDVSKVPDDGRPYRRVPPSNPAEHVIRGGSWKDKAEALTSGSRRKLAPSETDDAVGFRCVLLSAP